jgi:transcriptional regulator with XRE-family HTH domain
MDQNKAFSINLRSRRKSKGYTQERISKAIGIKISTYGAWEEGRSRPRLEHLAKICETLAIDDLYLFICKEIN